MRDNIIYSCVLLFVCFYLCMYVCLYVCWFVDIDINIDIDDGDDDDDDDDDDDINGDDRYESDTVASITIIIIISVYIRDQVNIIWLIIYLQIF